jgi:transposase
MAEENKALRKEIAKLRRANEILKAAAVSSGPSSTGPGYGDSVHRRAQGQPASRP